MEYMSKYIYEHLDNFQRTLEIIVQPFLGFDFGYILNRYNRHLEIKVKI